MRYPVKITPDDNGATIVEFPDVPQALATGGDLDEAMSNAQSALEMALGVYMERRIDIPVPSPIKRGGAAVYVPPLMAGKLAVYRAMRADDVSQTELACRLAMDTRQVRRLLDLKHRSRFDQIVAALAALGKRVDLEVVDF